MSFNARYSEIGQKAANQLSNHLKVKPFGRQNGEEYKQVGGAGFEPAKAEPTDLQSVPFDRFGTPPTHVRKSVATSSKSRRRDLNPRPAVYKTAALPTELRRHPSWIG